ncbi:hypothetical protein ACIGFK_02715 [Streptomyces sp. NPDC085524]|uniref:hypothetical protein n=1 Tax=Streptomyces sp. NPDC085524 TaxID=3365728 RepID=UPI0037D5057B
MKTRKLTPVLGSAAAGLLVLASGTVSAATQAGVVPAQAGVVPTQATAACALDPAVAHENVKIRNAAKVNATALGLLPKGAKATYAACQVSLAGTYSLCGWKGDNRWSYITYRGVKGYVPLACVV